RVESANRAAVDIAPGAMAEDNFVSVTTTALNEDLSALMLQSENKILVMPVGPAINFGPEGTVFATPATLTIPFTRSTLPHGKTERDVAIYNWDYASHSWQPLDTKLENGQLVTQAQHFSLYQAMVRGVNQAASAAFAFHQFYVYPNPAKGGNRPRLHLECGVGDGVDIRIYDVAGELRHNAHIDGGPTVLSPEYAYEYDWDMGGAGSGVYIAVIEAHSGGETVKAKKKFAIIR
ncbi:MAG: T9SS type A sorting domain-containing protein, partial [Elusimicrobiales bacterium]|nr:T9SS type A sorting domain-containing protein [Elusimicrobiales bacterium]